MSQVLEYEVPGRGEIRKKDELGGQVPVELIIAFGKAA